MVNYKYAELYQQDSLDKQVKIEYDGGTMTNSELFSESIELTESLCSETELWFGCCEASILKFKVANIMQPLSGKWLTVSETLKNHEDEPLQIGKYKVVSDKPTADRRYREITAYDAMYDIIQADVADWYNEILPNKSSTCTLKEFRTGFLSHFNLQQEEADLINDDMTVEKTIEPSEISGKDVISAICEINGCFGHIGRDGKFRYIYLEQGVQGLYPRDTLYPADDLYPQDPKSTRIGKNLYIECKYEDFLTRSISKLQIRQEENDIGFIIGTGDNCYIIEDNFLVYGKSSEQLKTIGERIYSRITGIVYRPYECDAKGNPCMEVGDAIRVPTRYEIVESYILKRTLKGIQALRDSYSADGTEYRTGNVNGIQKSIIQLKGKTNVLERTVEETRSTITDVEAGLQSQIVQTAESIKMTVAKSQAEWDTKDYTIEISSYGNPNSIIDENGELAYPPQKYKGKYYLDQETGTLYLSDGSNWNFVENLTKISVNLSSKIEQTYEAIELEVSRRQSEDEEIRSAINIYAGKIALVSEETSYNSQSIAQIAVTTEEIELSVSKKVGDDEVISKINMSPEGVSIQGNRIALEGCVTVNENVIFAKDGTITINGGRINVSTADSETDNVKFNYDGITVWMGSFGFQSAYGSQKSQMQYNEIYMESPASGGTGTVHIKATEQCVSSFGWGTSSDKRLKKDIQPLNKKSTAEFIYSLEPSKYRYIYDEKDIYRHGLIAQDVLAAMGEETWGLYSEQEERDGSKYATLNYSELIPDLIAVVQLQKEEIKNLQKDICELRNEILEIKGRYLDEQSV